MKKILSFAIVALTAFAVKAEYLYWQVDQANSATSSSDYVQLWTSTTDGATFYDSSFTKLGGTQSTEGGGFVQFDVGDSSSYKAYFVEYLTYDSSNNEYTSLGGYTGSWNELANAKALSSALSDSAASMVAYTGGTYKNVPEPTSGLMLLMGMALVALKRKRA